MYSYYDKSSGRPAADLRMPPAVVDLEGEGLRAT